MLHPPRWHAATVISPISSATLVLRIISLLTVVYLPAFPNPPGTGPGILRIEGRAEQKDVHGLPPTREGLCPPRV
jgi:hypothetical protein